MKTSQSSGVNLYCLHSIVLDALQHFYNLSHREKNSPSLIFFFRWAFSFAQNEMHLQKSLSKQYFSFTAEYIYSFYKKAKIVSCITLLGFMIWKGLSRIHCLIFGKPNHTADSVVTIHQVEYRVCVRKKGNLSFIRTEKNGERNSPKRVNNLLYWSVDQWDGKQT